MKKLLAVISILFLLGCNPHKAIVYVSDYTLESSESLESTVLGAQLQTNESALVNIGLDF